MQKHSLTLRIDKQLHEQVKEKAERANQSISEYIRNTLVRQFDTTEQPKAEEAKDNHIEWIKEQAEKTSTVLQSNQALLMELQAEKKYLHDENQKLKNQLSAPRIKLPKILSFLSTN